MDDDLGVRGRLEDGTPAHEFLAHLMRVGEIAVVGDCKAAPVGFHEDGLHVAQHGFARGRVAVVADGGMAGERSDVGPVREDLGDEAKIAVDMELRPVEGDDAGGFLASMLQGMKAEDRVGRRVLGSEDAEDTALLVQLVIVEGMMQRKSGQSGCPPLIHRP